MRNLTALIVGAIFATLSVSAAMTQDVPASFNAQNANVHSRPGGQALTLPSQAAAPSVVADFLRGEGLSGDTVGSLVLQSENSAARTGRTHLRFTQQVDGLTVFGAYVKATVNSNGQLIHLIEALATPGNVRPALIGARDALDAALAENHPGVGVILNEAGGSGNSVSFTGDDFFYRDPTVTRMAITMTNGSMQEGFLVETWSNEDNLLHHTLVGANGRVFGVQLRTNNDSINIFPDHPGNSIQTVTPIPGNWLSGPQTTVDISGNNAHAYLDTDANNSPDSGGSSVGDGNFTAPFYSAQEPETTDNQAFAVQNLFYWNNAIHDKLYSHGFVESAGNFQNDNFGNGGNGNDAVNAEAQDGSGTNNANFSTPSDGSPGRMQMYVWTITSPKRDGDLDTDIIWHEYGHGLTWRMIGSMSGPMSGAIGEGMGDVLAILNNGDDTVGEYSTNDPDGIRSAPYTNYLRTYGNMGGSSVHFDGEIYAATIWHLWEIFQANSVPLDTLFDYLIDGMNSTPSGPAFEDMRDGILASAAGSGNECHIWQAFADFGVGEGAQGSIKGGGPFGGGKVRITESFVVPDGCGGEITPVTDAAITTVTVNTVPILVNETNTVTVQVSNNGTTPIGPINVSLFENDSPVGTSILVSTLNAGETTDVIFPWTPTVAALRTLLASHDLLDDDDSGNDSKTENVTVTEPGDPGIVVVSGIAPAAVSTGYSDSTTISGSGFADGATVTFESGSGPTPTFSVSIVSGDGTTITGTLTVKNGGPPRARTWQARVTNTDNSTGVCSPACLTVNP